ncbi:MAG: diguanylate cyclase [Nitrospirae bacterium]|nr:diguanylate cyclase [Nitrospirota bacterium]
MDDKQRSVLIIDDEISLIKLIELKLKKAGFITLTAQDSESAMEILAGHHIDLIICDIQMPGMSGFEFREKILNEPSTRDIPFIFLTASSESVDQIKGFRLRVDDYITKPFDPTILIARARSVIERHDAFSEKSSFDQLTGLLNRQALQQRVEKELSRIGRYGGGVSVVFIDVDSFKQVNDAHGHSTGDLVLIQLGQLFQQKLRGIDFAGRYGGEEFVLCLVNTGKEGALELTKRLLSLFSGIPISDKKLTCTFSAGIASAPEDGTDFSVLCRKADEAMYISKKEGKNRVTLWK